MANINEYKRQRTIDLFYEGLFHKQIAQRLQIAQTSVSYILRKHKKGLGTKDKPRSGRPRKFSTRLERKRVIESKKNNKLTANELKSSLNLQNICSTSTVKLYLRRNGLFGRVAAKKPLLNSKQR